MMKKLIGSLSCIYNKTWKVCAWDGTHAEVIYESAVGTQSYAAEVPDKANIVGMCTLMGATAWL